MLKPRDNTVHAESIGLAAQRQHSLPRVESASFTAEQVRLLCSNLRSSIVISLALASIFIGVQWAVLAPSKLLLWSLLLGITLIYRAALVVRWKDDKLPFGTKEAELRLLLFRIGVFATSLVWGAAGVFLVPTSEPDHMVYTSFVLAGLSSGAATTLAIDRVSSFTFLLLAMAPHSLFLMFQDGSVSWGMGTMLLLFMFFLLGTTHRLHQQLEENFDLRQGAVESASQLRQMLEASPIATRIEDLSNKRVLFANSRYISLVESTAEEVFGQVSPGYYINPDTHGEILEKLDQGECITDKLIELCTFDERAPVKWALASFSPIEYEGRSAILGWFYEITDRKIMEEQVEHMAYHDTLTGLPNRLLIIDRLHQAITNAERERENVAVLFVDLDEFKPVNDTYGHNIGDALLKAIAVRISDCLRKSDSASRFGGDEFVILLPSVKDKESAVEVAEKIRHALVEPFDVEGLTLKISSSTGVVLYPEHAEEVKQLLKRADMAMYHAKGEGRNRVKVFQPDMFTQIDDT
ncbi:sensor domain-containing diguanylate cyclase [Marinobacterium sp. D7]|uniref:sensor domain-containing diguanylate cyclase n=1 Tax=Marinobacterium ramblicola TaxID=2849041 RepID=UPI001C2DAF1C|nr:sensor domain-containing diguanylate cyclase [Marinobacterium ramblicola]MBV1789740.1 sensor domain-containing diguanylate cyclase [Marinobacterium ramblicola]